jgi:hypothetical protein
MDDQGTEKGRGHPLLVLVTTSARIFSMVSKDKGRGVLDPQLAQDGFFALPPRRAEPVIISVARY